MINTDIIIKRGKGGGATVWLYLLPTGITAADVIIPEGHFSGLQNTCVVWLVADCVIYWHCVLNYADTDTNAHTHNSAFVFPGFSVRFMRFVGSE